MTSYEALEAALVKAFGSGPMTDVRVSRVIMNCLHELRFTVAPTPGRVSILEHLKEKLAMAEFARRKVMQFARTILHGDAEHRAWLLEAAKAFNEGLPVPPARNANGPLQDNNAPVIRDFKHWNKVGPGTPLGVKLETMHQDEYVPARIADIADAEGKYQPIGEHRVNLCMARIILAGDEIEWIDSRGYSTLVNPGSFKAPTHWRWQRGRGH